MLCGLLLIQCVCAVLADYHIQSIAGDVESGNYTYYKLQWDGPVSIILESKSGDADLYVSETLLKPTFEPEEHDFSSATCGTDQVDIPRTASRPLGVSVYGHPRHSVSRYELHLVYRHPDYLDAYTLREGNDTGDPLLQQLRRMNRNTEDQEDNRLMDLIWTFAEVFLEVLLL